ADRALLGDVVAHAPSAGDRVQPRARRRHPRRDGVHALVRCVRVHAAVRVPARPALPPPRPRRGPGGAGGERGHPSAGGRARRGRVVEPALVAGRRGRTMSFAGYVIAGWTLTALVIL